MITQACTEVGFHWLTQVLLVSLDYMGFTQVSLDYTGFTGLTGLHGFYLITQVLIAYTGSLDYTGFIRSFYWITWVLLDYTGLTGLHRFYGFNWITRTIPAQC